MAVSLIVQGIHHKNIGGLVCNRLLQFCKHRIKVLGRPVGNGILFRNKFLQARFLHHLLVDSQRIVQLLIRQHINMPFIGVLPPKRLTDIGPQPVINDIIQRNKPPLFCPGRGVPGTGIKYISGVLCANFIQQLLFFIRIIIAVYLKVHIKSGILGAEPLCCHLHHLTYLCFPHPRHAAQPDRRCCNSKGDRFRAFICRLPGTASRHGKAGGKD